MTARRRSRVIRATGSCLAICLVLAACGDDDDDDAASVTSLNAVEAQINETEPAAAETTAAGPP